MVMHLQAVSDDCRQHAGIGPTRRPQGAAESRERASAAAVWETILPKTATIAAPAPVIKLPQPREVKFLHLLQLGDACFD